MKISIKQSAAPPGCADCSAQLCNGWGRRFRSRVELELPFSNACPGPEVFCCRGDPATATSLTNAAGFRGSPLLLSADADLRS